MSSKSNLEAAAGALIFLAFLLLVGFVGTVFVGLVRMEVTRSQERAAVRAALTGDCEGAVAHAARAGRVPPDVRVICSEGR